VSLSADLLALGAMVAPEEAQWNDPELPKAVLCPRLRTTYSPRVSWRGFGPRPEEQETPPHLRAWARLWDPAEPDPLGLSPAPNSERPARYGLKGMTGAGRRQVWRSLCLLEEKREQLAFWTVTLGPNEIEQLRQLGTLPLFQDRLRQELRRLLLLAGMSGEVIGVCEIHPRRSRSSGLPVPHWHIVFRGRRTRYHCWALDRWQLDSVIGRALATAGVHNADLRAAGRIERVKASVRGYLGAYMTKKHVDPAPFVGGEGESLIPRQWWFWTGELRAWVMQHVLPLAFGFLNWCHTHREAIQSRGLASWRLLDLPDPRAPDTYEVNWNSCEHVAQLVYLWQLDAWDAQWERSQRLQQWQHSPSAPSPAISTLMSAC
jgi:hypothetical protein